MGLVYGFVSDGSTVLAEHEAVPGNFREVGLKCLKNVNLSESTFTIECEGHNFNFLRGGAFHFLVVSRANYGREVPFACLDQISDEFRDKFAGKSDHKRFGARIKYHMGYCESHPEEVSKIARVQMQVHDVKQIMIENIDAALGRGERMESLADKAEGLRTNALEFQKGATTLRRKMWWQNKKMQIMFVCILLIIGLVIFLLVCFTGGNCFK